MDLSALRLIACAVVLSCFCAIPVSAQPCVGQDVSCSDPETGAITADDPDQISGLYSCGEPLDSLPGEGADHIYVFTPQVTGEVIFGLSNLNCNLDLYVLESGCDPGDACIAGSTQGSTSDESVAFDAIAGVIYYLVIEVRDAMPAWPCTYTLAVLNIGVGGCLEDCNNGIDDDENGETDCAQAICGPDTDGDGICDVDDPDDDNDGVPDIDDPAPLNPSVCGDTDGDTCDDCAGGTDGFGPLDDFDPLNDGPDTDGDGLCDFGDPDDDNDGVPDADDPDPLDPDLCGDTDGDLCDDCAVGTDDFGPMDDFNTANDGPDTDGDGLCNEGDPDDDNDGVPDNEDSDPLDPDLCGDTDNDTCDDCAVGTDGFGPNDDFNVLNDGQDTDGDGLCDAGDPDDDNDGVPDNEDPEPLNPYVCGDTDGDLCDDCAIGTDGFGPNDDFLPLNDGTDTDGDGLCDDGDPDDDNDGVPDFEDPEPLNPDVCGDSDNDSCDDCAVGTDDFGPNDDFNPLNDGPDADLDGICDLSDNCPNHANPLQSDLNNNGIGDVCDTAFITVDNVGIGTDTPITRLHVVGGIPFIDNASGGFYMRAPDGSCWFVSVNNAGVLSSVEVDCP